MSWLGYAWRRAGSVPGLFWTLVALVGVTTGVIAGAVGWTSAAASSSAREAVVGPSYEMTARTRSGADPAAQDRLATTLIRDAFAPAPVLVSQAREGEFVTYTVAADVDRLAPDDLPHFERGAQGLLQTLRESEVNHNGVVVDGDLAAAAQLAAANLAVSRALGLVPLSVLVLVTVLAVGQVARLLSRSRERSTALLVARGASGRQIFALDAAESTVIVALGGLLGVGLATAAVAAVGAGAHAGSVWLAGAITLCGTWLMVLGMLALHVRAATRPGFDADRSGRAATAIAGVSVAAVLALALVALWQLARTGSPLSWHDGQARVNVVAGAAPALLLAGVGVVALGLLGPLATAATAGARRLRGAAAFLAAAQTARRVRTLAVPVVLTVLATGATTTAALYDGTSADLRDAAAAITVGAPVRAAISALPDELPAEAGATVPVWRAAGTTIGDHTVEAVIAPAEPLSRVVAPPDGMTLVPEALDSATDDPGLVVPDGDHVTMRLGGRVEADAWTMAWLRTQADALAAQVEVWRPDLTEQERAMDVQSALRATAQTHSAPMRLSVRLSLREPSTGRTAQVTSEAVELPGPAIVVSGPTGDDISMTPAQPVEREVRIPIEPGRGWRIDEVRFEHVDERAFQMWSRRLDVEFALRGADGSELLGERTAGWASAEATSPDEGGEAHARLESTQPEFRIINRLDELGNGSFEIADNYSFLRPLLDTTQATWRVRIYDAPELAFWGVPVSAHSRPAEPDMFAPPGAEVAAQGVRMAMTSELADAVGLSVGRTTTVMVLNRLVEAELVGLVDAVVGTDTADAILVDLRSLSLAFPAGEPLPPPTELWANPEDVPAAVAALEGALDVDVQVGHATPTDPTKSARLIFWVACAGAALLAVTGIAVASATMTRERRAEVLVLRAIGAPTRLQSGTRVAELVSSVLASTLFGLAGGWLVGVLVVPALAQATIAPGQVGLRPAMTMSWGPWLATLAAGGLALAVVALRLAARVRAEALDDEYREEVR